MSAAMTDLLRCQLFATAGCGSPVVVYRRINTYSILTRIFYCLKRYSAHSKLISLISGEVVELENNKPAGNNATRQIQKKSWYVRATIDLMLSIIWMISEENDRSKCSFTLFSTIREIEDNVSGYMFAKCSFGKRWLFFQWKLSPPTNHPLKQNNL